MKVDGLAKQLAEQRAAAQAQAAGDAGKLRQVPTIHGLS